MTLPRVMIGATFVAGLVLLTIGVLALLKKRGAGGGGKLKALGIEIEGKNGATVIFLIGAGFVSAGFGWAATSEEARTAQEEAKQKGREAEVEREFAEKARVEVVRANEAMIRLTADHKVLHDKLRTVINKPELDKIETMSPWLKGDRAWQPSVEMLRPRTMSRSSIGGG